MDTPDAIPHQNSCILFACPGVDVVCHPCKAFRSLCHDRSLTANPNHPSAAGNRMVSSGGCSEPLTGAHQVHLESLLRPAEQVLVVPSPKILLQRARSM